MYSKNPRIGTKGSLGRFLYIWGEGNFQIRVIDSYKIFNLKEQLESTCRTASCSSTVHSVTLNVLGSDTNL